MYIDIKPYGFFFRVFHCNDVAITCCKHTYDPFYLGEFLRENNNCSICEQILHLDWMQSWGFEEKDFAMKKLAIKMEIKSSWKAMKLSLGNETTSLSIFQI
jgi:hypothetical protein